MADKTVSRGDVGFPEGWVLLADGTYGKQIYIAGQAAGAGALTPKGNALVTITSTAATLTALLTAAGALSNVIPAGSSIVYIQPRGGDIRFTDDGQTPTVAGLGIDIYDKVAWPYQGTLSAVKLIAAGNTPCSLVFYG